MNHAHDSKALELSREVMALVYGPMPVGGSVQLQAKIQCMFAEAMEFAASTFRENENSSTNNFRENAETSTGTAITPAAPDKKLTDDVLDEIIAGAKTSLEQHLALSLKAEREVWRKEGPTDDERIMAIEGIHNCERCGDEGWVVGEMGITRCACGQDAPVCTCPSGDSSLRWPCPSHPGNSPRHAADSPVAWHHTAKSKKGNYGTCCFSYAPLHDFGSEYEKTESQPHYLPEKLNYDKALRFLSDAPRKLTEETPTVGNSPVIPDGYVMVPKEPTDEMIAAAKNCDDVLFNSDESFCVQFGNIYEAMLAAAPTGIPMNSNGWIPVSERMPEDAQWCAVITEYGYYVQCWSDGQGWLGDDISIPNVDVTHWMLLPAGPQEVMKDEANNLSPK